MQDVFRESGAFVYASFAQLQSWIFGLPVLAVLASSSTEAIYFGRICLIWIFGVSSIVVVVGPTLVNAIRMRRNPNIGQNTDRIRISGLQTQVVSLQVVRKAAKTRNQTVSNCVSIN